MHSVLNRRPLLSPSSRGSEICAEEEVVGDFKEKVSSRQCRADTHMNPEKLWQHAQDLCKLKLDKNLSVEKGKWIKKVTPLTKKLFLTKKRKISFFLVECHC